MKAFLFWFLNLLARGLRRWRRALFGLTVRTESWLAALEALQQQRPPSAEASVAAVPGDPPPHWLARVERGGPPRHWLTYIHERAPHLLPPEVVAALHPASTAPTLSKFTSSPRLPLAPPIFPLRRGVAKTKRRGYEKVWEHLAAEEPGREEGWAEEGLEEDAEGEAQGSMISGEEVYPGEFSSQEQVGKRTEAQPSRRSASPPHFSDQTTAPAEAYAMGPVGPDRPEPTLPSHARSTSRPPDRMSTQSYEQTRTRPSDQAPTPPSERTTAPPSWPELPISSLFRPLAPAGASPQGHVTALSGDHAATLHPWPDLPELPDSSHENHVHLERRLRLQAWRQRLNREQRGDLWNESPF